MTFVYRLHQPMRNQMQLHHLLRCCNSQTYNIFSILTIQTNPFSQAHAPEAGTAGTFQIGLPVSLALDQLLVLERISFSKVALLVQSPLPDKKFDQSLLHVIFDILSGPGLFLTLNFIICSNIC